MKRKIISCLLVIMLAAPAMAQSSLQKNTPSGPANHGLVDWAQFQFDAAHTGYNPYEVILSPQTVGSLVLAWAAHPGFDNVWSSPTIANGMLYFGTGNNGVLYALDAQTGAYLWGASVPHSEAVGTPAVAYGNVYVAGITSEGGDVHAFFADTGSPSWNGGDGDIPSDVTVDNSTVYVASHHFGNARYSGLYALNASSGQIVWQYYVDSGGYGATPTVANNMVYAPCDLGLCAFNASTGSVQWQFSTPEGFTFYTPAVSNGVVYAGASLSVYNEREIVWSYLYALDAATGTLLWRSPLLPTLGPAQQTVATTTPAVANGVIYIGLGTTDPDYPVYGYMYAVDASTGRHLWQYKATAQVSSPAVANGVVYFGTKDAAVYALDATKGAVLWKYITGMMAHGNNVTTSSPVIVNGMVYIGTAGWFNSNVYAFHLPKQ